MEEKLKRLCGSLPNLSGQQSGSAPIFKVPTENLADEIVRNQNIISEKRDFLRETK
jgi:hypothetical protein